MNIAVIFAGGTGQRMNSRTKPKQFLLVYGKPIIIYTLEAFDQHPDIDAIVVVCLKEYIDVSNIGQLPSSPYNLRFAYAANNPAAINFADINSVPEMQEFYLSIKNNTGSTITQPIPNGSGWQSDEASIEIEAGKTAGVSIKKEHGIMVVRV